VGREVVYGRYVWKSAVIGLVLVAAGAPTVEQATEALSDDAPVAHRFVRNDHGYEAPPPMKLSVSSLSVAGTAVAATATAYRFTPVATTPVPYRELKQ
jgi:hypothetical protein